MKRIAFFLVSFGLVSSGLFFSSRVNALTSESQVAQKYQISFPVAELGSCNSISECKSYCSDSAHSAACISFAKRKGFYKQAAGDARKVELLQAAKTELGCTTEATCKVICRDENNFEKCRDLGKRILSPQPINSGKDELIRKAKELLGCEDAEQCRTFCEQEANREACRNVGGTIKNQIEEQRNETGGRARDPVFKDSELLKDNIRKREFQATPAAQQREEFCKRYPRQCPKVIPSNSATGDQIIEKRVNKQLPVTPIIKERSLNTLPTKPLPELQQKQDAVSSGEVRGATTELSFLNFAQEVLIQMGF